MLRWIGPSVLAAAQRVIFEHEDTLGRRGRQTEAEGVGRESPVTLHTELREDKPPRCRLPADCFFCSTSVTADDVHVDGATAEIWLHRRHCAEELGLGLIRLADWRRPPTRPGLRSIA